VNAEKEAKKVFENKGVLNSSGVVETRENVVRREEVSRRKIGGWEGMGEDRLVETHNFTPLRGVMSEGWTMLDRAAREWPLESRFELLKRRREPEFCREAKGTPRREYQEGMIEGVRIRGVQNPYYVPNRRELRAWNNWGSRNWKMWNAHECFVRGSRKKYAIPMALMPTKDELGEAHPPALSARYVADVKKQFILNGLPWIYEKDFLATKPKVHFRDRPPKVRRRWIRRELRLAKIDQALKNMDTLVKVYRKEKTAAKPNSWFDKVVNEIAGEQVAAAWVRKPKLSKG
jgi:hypothetical protein